MIADKIHNRDYHISREVPSLIEIATSVVAYNFQIYPQLTGLEDPYLKEQLIEQISLDLPITITAPFI